MDVHKFIKKNIDLIDDEEWKTLYKECDKFERGKLTDILLSVGINPFEDLTHIPEYAFHKSKQLEFTIPDGVTSIGRYAFNECTNLKSVTMGSRIKSIGSYAFYNCTNLGSIVLPKSVRKIGEEAFFGCWSIQSIDIPDGVKSISKWVFVGCSSLTSVTIPNSVTEIGE